MLLAFVGPKRLPLGAEALRVGAAISASDYTEAAKEEDFVGYIIIGEFDLQFY